MKKILFLLAFLPILSFAQISHWRSGGGSGGGGNYGSPRMSVPQNQIYMQPNVSQWRNNPPAPQNPKPYIAPSYRNYNYFNHGLRSAPSSLAFGVGHDIFYYD